MRRKDREVAELPEIQKIMDKCKVMRIAMIDDGEPYIVPLNFGYCNRDGKIFLYFHSALQGRKIDILKENPRICFEMDCEHKLLEDEIACKNGFFFESVIGTGTVTFAASAQEKVEAFDYIMKHQTGKTFEIHEKAVGGVIIGIIEVDSICGKARHKK